MALQSYDNLDLRLLSDVTQAWVMGEQVSIFDAAGNLVIGTPAEAPPELLTPPSILPEEPALGQTISLSLGQASGVPLPVAEWDLTLDGVSIRDQLDPGAMTMELTSPGSYVLSVIWINASGTVDAGRVTLTVAAPQKPVIDYAGSALVYIDANTAISGTAADVIALNTAGSGKFILSKTGSGAAVQMTNAGVVFGDGVYLQSPTLSEQPMTDGLFVVADITLTEYGSNIGQILEGTGGHVKLRNNAGTIQGTGIDDSSLNLGLGAVQYGTRMIFAVQIDDLADTLSGYDASGNPVSVAHTGLTDPALTRISIGRYLKGTIHRLAIFGRAEGQPWAATMREVVEDFRQGA